MATKYAILIGEIKGKPVVLDGPTVDTDKLVKAIEKLTNGKGKTKVGGKAATVEAAVILHNTKGVIKRRKHLGAPTPAERAAAAEEARKAAEAEASEDAETVEDADAAEESEEVEESSEGDAAEESEKQDH